MTASKVYGLVTSISWLLSVLFRVCIEMMIGFEAASWIQIISFFGLLLALLIYRNWRIVLVFIVLIVGVMLISHHSLSEKIVLGEKLGVIYEADTPAWVQITIYPTTCVIEGGGIFGASSKIFAKYKLTSSDILIDSKDIPSDLKNEIIYLDNRPYTISTKDNDKE